MHRRRGIATLLRAISAWWYWTLALIAAAAFAAPLFEASTKEDPSGGAGISAPIVALCAAAILLSEALNAGELRIRRIPSMFVAIGGLASAYLWVSDAAKTHPTNPELPLVLAVILGSAAVATIAVPLFVLTTKQDSNE